MSLKNIPVSYSSPSSMMSLRHQLISKIEVSQNRELLETCLELMSDDPMPCFMSEEELDKEIDQSLKGGNATNEEVNAVFTRWMH